MSDTPTNPQADLAFLRELASDTGAGLVRDGAIMISVGLIFGLISLVYWVSLAGLVPGLGRIGWTWLAGLLLFFTITPLVIRKMPPSTGAASRALATAWGCAGGSMVPPCLGVLLAGARMGNWELALWIYPILLFTLYGVAWTVAFAVKRQAWLGLVAAGCYLAAFAEGFFFSSPHQWLVLAVGLLVLAALPGWILVRQARAG